MGGEFIICCRGNIRFRIKGHNWGKAVKSYFFLQGIRFRMVLSSCVFLGLAVGLEKGVMFLREALGWVNIVFRTKDIVVHCEAVEVLRTGIKFVAGDVMVHVSCCVVEV